MMPNMRATALFAIGFLLLSSTLGFADSNARALYDAGKFQEALDTLTQAGLGSAADYFDAGNCYYRLGKLGQALGYYEKANALAPGDDDIRYNLKLIEGLAEKGGTLTRDQTYWTGLIVPLVRRVPETVVDVLFAICTAVLAWNAFRAKKRGRRFLKALLQPAFLLALGIWGLSGLLTTVTILGQNAKLAAIIADVGIGRSGPNETFTELFKLSAGTTVELTGENREGWRQIRFSLGNVGWIMEKDLLPL